MSKKEEIENLLEEMATSGKLPYVSKYWEVHEIKEATPDKTCYSCFYNGYVFTDLPTKPISTPFEFNGNS